MKTVFGQRFLCWREQKSKAVSKNEDGTSSKVCQPRWGDSILEGQGQRLRAAGQRSEGRVGRVSGRFQRTRARAGSSVGAGREEREGVQVVGQSSPDRKRQSQGKAGTVQQGISLSGTLVFTNLLPMIVHYINIMLK